MKILLVNDDGICSEGIRHLAQVAMEFGEVTVIAPEGECSAMSQHITVRDRLFAREHDFPLPVKKAWAVSGTPADCVKVGLAHILTERPDYVFSGINNGYNAGGDILYSGTVGAAMEGLVQGIPAIAFSNGFNATFDTLLTHIREITERILSEEKLKDEIWNVNFPGISADECRGVLWDRKPSPYQYYKNTYEITRSKEGIGMVAGGDVTEHPMALNDTDMSALVNGYVSVGKVRCMVPVL